MEQQSLLDLMDVPGLGEEEDVEQEEWTVPELEEGECEEEEQEVEEARRGRVARLAVTEARLAAMEHTFNIPLSVNEQYGRFTITRYPN